LEKISPEVISMEIIIIYCNY